MAATEPAASGPPRNDLIDLYGDLNQNDEDFDKTDEASDLYDAVLTGSVNRMKKMHSIVVVPDCKEIPAEEQSKPPVADTNKGGNTLKKFSLYIGNFPWWTSDADLLRLAQNLGVRDVTEIKFAENRANGQSRGYAELAVTTEDSLKKLLEKIPKCELHGDRLNCRFATYQNVALFEATANKRIPLRVNSKDFVDTDSMDKIPSLLSQESSPTTIPANRLPLLPNPFHSQPPPPFPPMLPNIPPPLAPHLAPHLPPHLAPHLAPHLPLFPPQSGYVGSQPSPSLHTNPGFFNQGHDSHSNTDYTQQKHTPRASDFEELMNRNRAVASSAITKAVSGATAGYFQMATETLLTAIAVIKQSRAYRDERCQALVTSLKDCLVSIQGNCSYRDSHRSSERERDRDRGRDRERDREDSYGWEGAGMSRRHRERSWSGERDRERDRQKDHRNRYR
ncbi:cleavage and polyadenylation specificity factor subunit 7-like [Diretmus argenteus]